MPKTKNYSVQSSRIGGWFGGGEQIGNAPRSAAPQIITVDPDQGLRKVNMAIYIFIFCIFIVTFFHSSSYV